MALTPPWQERIRLMIEDGLPTLDEAGTHLHQQASMTYVPPAHAQALELERPVVEGIRGSGKSFWWKALVSEEHRRFVCQVFPEARLGDDIDIRQGFGGALGDDAPSKDVLAALMREFGNARAIWRAVIGHQLKLGAPFPHTAAADRGVWQTRTAWVRDHPEQFDRLLLQTDTQQTASGRHVLILFDALDSLADRWEEIRPLARGLFQVTQEMRATRMLRCKLFVRPDMLEDKEILGFPDSSKLLARKANLAWRKVDLYGLVFQCLGNYRVQEHGEQFRFLTEWSPETKTDGWRHTSGQYWTLGPDLRTDESRQEILFHHLTGRAMSAAPSGHKRGKPYKWVVSHLQDGRDQVSPRSFCEALRHAATHTQHEYPAHSLPLHFKALQSGVQEASKIRVDELEREDYPWLSHVMAPLKGSISVPCAPSDITDLWRQGGTIDALERHLQQSDHTVKLPPQHLADGADGVMRDLEDIGLLQRLPDGRIQMPDVYRIAFGLGRRGGVKPLK